MTPRRARNLRAHQLKGSDSNLHHLRVQARPYRIVRIADGMLLSGHPTLDGARRRLEVLNEGGKVAEIEGDA